MTDIDLAKFDSLEDLYSKQYIKLLKEISKQKEISYDEIYEKLPSSELVKKDEDFIDTYPVARVLLGFADPASYVLTALHIVDKIPEDYPEQPRYYISTSEGTVKAPFTKQEFIDSIKKQKVKKLEEKQEK